MKKTRLFLTLGFLTLAVLAAHAQQGGFDGPGDSGRQGRSQGGFAGERQVVTVAQALTFRDDTPVILQGRIVRALGNEKYLFEDATGTIVIEIDHDKWRGLTVGPEDRVEISGEVERGRNRVEIDVDRIIKL